MSRKITFYFLRWRPSPATINVALNFTEYHLLTGFQERPSLPYQGLERRRKETWKWQWCRAHGWPRLSCDFADVGFEDRPEQVRLVWDHFPIRSRQDVFNEPQRVSAVTSQQPSSLLRAARKGACSGTGKIVENSSNPGNAVSETTTQTLDMIYGSISGKHVIVLRVLIKNV